MPHHDDFFADADVEPQPASPRDVDANGAGPPAARSAPPARGTATSLRDVLTGASPGEPLAARAGRPPAAATPVTIDERWNLVGPAEFTDHEDESSEDRRGPRPIRRSEVHHRLPTPWDRLRAWFGEQLTSAGERAEREQDARLSRLVGASRMNLIVLVGPRGGAGKTMAARVIGGLLATARIGTVLHKDADQDYGPAADLVPDTQRSTKTIMDLLADFDAPPTPPELRPYTSRFEDGLLVLAAPKKRTDMKKLADELEHYERALELLRGVDVVLMDCAGGIGKVQEWALARADQAIVMCPPDYVAANNIAQVLNDEDLELPERTTLVLNDTRPEGGGDLAAIERHFARHNFEERIRVPYDHKMRLMLDQATYTLDALPRTTRLPLKRLAATVGEGLR